MADFVNSDVKKVREVFDWVRVNEHYRKAHDRECALCPSRTACGRGQQGQNLGYRP